ncbi:MAG: O-antigen ligase family protein [Solirubrobacteraceae bacterium]
MRTAVVNSARSVLLGGPTVLAFLTGGYFETARVWAGLIAWLLVVVVLLACERPPPRAGAARLALGGLALLAAWTLLSTTWAPIAGSAYQAGQLVVLYTGFLFAAAALLDGRRVQLVVEPVLAAGALIVIGYGISERLLPGWLHFARSVTAEGRLEQPLTYWNALGELAAIGLVLAVRIAGEEERARRLRAAAAAAAVPLALGLYLSFSRGALFACAAGLVTLIVAAPRRAQLHSLLLALLAGGLVCAVAAPLRGVSALAGSLSTRERDGAIMLAALAVIAIGAALAQRALAARGDAPRELRLPAHAPWMALAVICAGFALAVSVGAKEGTSTTLAAGASRLESLQSNRYAYWRVALRAFEDEPLRGVGAGGWAVWWLRYRTVNEAAQDAHSLPLQTAAELGLVGLALLLSFLGGVACGARAAFRSAPARSAGIIAGFVVYVAHSPLDWDWQMPAVTLAALVLAGALLALSSPA